MEMHPAVRLHSQFNPHAVNIMSQHLVMLMVDTCQSGYVTCMMTTKKKNKFKIRVFRSVGVL